jgi:hypothetical protein
MGLIGVLAGVLSVFFSFFFDRVSFGFDGMFSVYTQFLERGALDLFYEWTLPINLSNRVERAKCFQKYHEKKRQSRISSLPQSVNAALWSSSKPNTDQAKTIFKRRN